MTSKEIQKLFNKATAIKKHSIRLIDEKEQPIGERRSIEQLDRFILKLCEQYEAIYNKLTKDAARNNWRICQYNVYDPFDYETFDNDADYLT